MYTIKYKLIDFHPRSHHDKILIRYEYNCKVEKLCIQVLIRLYGSALSFRPEYAS